MDTYNWELEPQEREGTYTFSGRIYATSKVTEILTEEELNLIIFSVKQRVAKLNGADYLQVFTHPEKEKIYVIDQLNKEMKRDSTEDYIKENDYFTILFASEY